MNVEKVKYRINNPAHLQKKPQRPQHFTGMLGSGTVSTGIDMGKEVSALMPSSVKAMKKVSDNMGEVQNIIINALGTGLVAPIFIKWNPLSKTDEDTRTYSAWRQPVSAVLAVVTQVGITIPFNRMIERRGNNGFYDEDFNKTLFQDKKYIAKQIKQQYPHATAKQLEALTKAKMNEQKANLRRMIKENKIIMSTYEGKPHKYSDEKFINLLNEVVDKKLAFENSEKERCEKVIKPRKIQRCEYYRANNEEALKIFTEIDKKLENSSPQEVKKYVKSLLKNTKKDSELASIYTDILDRRGNNDQEIKIAMKDKLKGILEDIEKYSPEKFPTSESLATHIKNVGNKTRLNPIEDAIEILNNMKEQIKNKKTVAQIEEYLDKIVNNAAETGGKEKHRLANFKLSDEVAKALENKVKNNLKGHKQIMGLIVSFLMLPVSCSLLNWCYPRFMDAVFPNLSNKKHPQEVKDLVEKANQQMEVK